MATRPQKAIYQNIIIKFVVQDFQNNSQISYHHVIIFFINNNALY